MREATGELNMTMVTIVIIAALVALAGAFVVPAIQSGIRRNTCASALGVKAEDVTTSTADKCCAGTNCIDIK